MGAVFGNKIKVGQQPRFQVADELCRVHKVMAEHPDHGHQLGDWMDGDENVNSHGLVADRFARLDSSCSTPCGLK